MTSAVGSLSQQVYAPAIATGAAAVDDQSPAAASTAATPPSAPSLPDSELLDPSTVSALVAGQAAPADASGEQDGTANASRSYYELFMPTREGFSAHALAVAIDDPNAVSSSAGKSDEEIATDARARLDANYARMKESGEEFKYNTNEGVDRDSLFGDLDPKSLAAVRDNRGGLFSEQEQGMAKYFLDVQDSFRQGGYNGPTRLVGLFYASSASKLPADAAADVMKGWDTDAAKAKTDIGVQLGRAAMRVQLGKSASAQLFGDDKTSPDNRMMALLADALQTAQEKDPDVLSKIGNIHTADDLSKQDWFKDHVQELNAILRGMAGGDDADAQSEPAPAT